MTEEELLRELEGRMKSLSVDGLWSETSEADRATYSKDPRTSVMPHLWKWNDLYETIQTVGNMRGLDGRAERRVLRLINPAYVDAKNRRNRTTTHTMLMTLQLLKPGEVAQAHRHNFAAFRFILKGTGAYTVVEGEKLPMSEGDLILTPPMTWHEHHNHASPVIWLDGLDNPLLFHLQLITWEAYGGTQPLKGAAEASAVRVGRTRPAWERTADAPAYNLLYPWTETYETLKQLAASPCSPFDGVALEYVNPRGGHTMPTMSCGVQMLRPGEVTQTHRHNYSTIYHAFRGSGRTIIDGQKFDWDQGDCFVVPLWSWHSHQNQSRQKESILFSVSDRPVVEALKLYREEPGETA
jgi:gentisate 1,2-dioxygenase